MDEFEKYMGIAEQAGDEAHGGESDKLMAAYEKISAQAKATEEKMNELYTAIDGLDDEEAGRFSKIYEEFNKLLVEFQDMVLTVQGIINAGGANGA